MGKRYYLAVDVATMTVVVEVATVDVMVCVGALVVMKAAGTGYLEEQNDRASGRFATAEARTALEPMQDAAPAETGP